MSTRWSLVVGIAMTLVACGERLTREERIVRRWLLCNECESGERDSVVALGDSAVDALRDALWSPAEAAREVVRQQARAMYRRIPNPQTSEASYIARYDSNYVASYQKRAAMGLQAIGTPRARDVLLDALRRDVLYRRDVRRVVGRSVGASVSPAAGDSQHAALDSFVKVDPAVRVIDGATAEGIQAVRVVFRIDSGGGAALPTIRFTDSAGRAAVQWRLGAAATDTVNLLRATAAGQTVRFRAIAHPPGLRLVFLAQPGNGIAGQPIAGPVRVALQDAFGVTQASPGAPDMISVAVMGTAIQGNFNLVGGVAELTGFTVPLAGNGLRLRATRAGAAPAISAAFDLSP